LRANFTMETNAITSVIENILQKLGVPHEGITVTELGGSTFFSIKTKDSGILIGTRGETLSALSHVVKKILEKTIPHDFHYVVDVNGYHAKKIKDLEDQARLVAERARTFRYDIELDPMSSYERMIIHSTLKEMPDIQTSSVGEGPMRHIVVRYKDPNFPTEEV